MKLTIDGLRSHRIGQFAIFDFLISSFVLLSLGIQISASNKAYLLYVENLLGILIPLGILLLLFKILLIRI